MSNHNSEECTYCGSSHPGICPRVKAIYYYPDGNTKRVEFHCPWENMKGKSDCKEITMESLFPRRDERKLREESEKRMGPRELRALGEISTREKLMDSWDEMTSFPLGGDMK